MGSIKTQILRGENRKLMLSNRAITAYERQSWRPNPSKAGRHVHGIPAIRCCGGSPPDLDALPDRCGDRVVSTTDMPEAEPVE